MQELPTKKIYNYFRSGYCQGFMPCAMGPILEGMKATEIKAARKVRHTQSYTVLRSGDPEWPSDDDLAVLVLARGEGFYRDMLFESLYAAGFTRIVHAASGADRAQGERMSRRFPGVRFLLSSGSPNPGALLNLGMREMGTGKVLVLWSDMRLATSAISFRLRRKICGSSALCVTPVLAAADGARLEAVFSPAARDARIKPRIAVSSGILPVEGRGEAAEASPNLFPRDYCGIYDAELFLASGGFDESISDPWWQVVDFGLGAWAAGESVVHMPSVELRYEGTEPAAGPVVGKVPGAAWTRLWLKRLRARDPGACPSVANIIPYLLARRGPAGEGLREYRKLLSWRRNASGVSMEEAFERFERFRRRLDSGGSD